MENKNVYIPTYCKVGFNIRQDTYTKKLGYIIYKKDNEWKQEKSWETWREKYITEEEFQEKKLEQYKKDVEYYTNLYNKAKGTPKPNYYDHTWNTIDKYSSLEDYLKLNKLDNLENYGFRIYKSVTDIGINPIEFDNVPLEGFVLNKKVGGHRSGWNHRNAYARVYHPLGFEFEISFENVLYLLENTNFIVGKGIEGKCILGWQGKNIVLIPENSSDYTEYEKFTKAQHTKNIKLSDLKVGYKYKTRQGETWLYLGKFQRYISIPLDPRVKEKDLKVKLKNVHWFCNVSKENAYVVSFNYFYKDTCSVIIEELEQEHDIQKYYDELKKDSQFSGFEYVLKQVDVEEVKDFLKSHYRYPNNNWWFFDNDTKEYVSFKGKMDWYEYDKTGKLSDSSILNTTFYRIITNKLN